jgi:hypothetical protein
MPKGVEHIDPYWLLTVLVTVEGHLMPKGVEHAHEYVQVPRE